MTTHTAALWQIAEALYPSAAVAALRALAVPLDVEALLDLNRQTPGPHLTLLRENKTIYAAADRDVFRPLEYCARFLGAEESARVWLARGTVHMAGLHLEALVKRVARLGPVPLGAGLRAARVRRLVGSAHWEQLVAFAHVYNASKHDVNQPLNTHLFSVEDAVVAYCVSRRLALPLYPLACLSVFAAGVAPEPT